jgi:hypothetical protein
MRTGLATVGCYCAVTLVILACIASLLTSDAGRVVVGVCAGLVALLAIVCIPHNMRVWRARRAFRKLPGGVKVQVHEAIRKAAAGNPSVTLLLPDDGPCCESQTAVLSHAGGVPYAEEGDVWPVQRGWGPAAFLLQVRIDEPDLGDLWQGRLIGVFLLPDNEPVVWSHEGPSLEKYAPIAPPVPPLGRARLRSLPAPARSKSRQIPISPTQLCRRVPEIRTLLSPFAGDVPGLLSQVLRANPYGYNLEAPDIAYQGGSPMLIQSPHRPTCSRCHRRMRFLFQFGEIIPGHQLGDDGVGYVYGCDDHPSHCKAFIDSH